MTKSEAWLALVLLSILQVVDLISTAYLLEQPGFYEGNPLQAMIFESSGITGMAMFKAVFLSLLTFLIWQWNTLTGHWQHVMRGFLIIFNVIYSAVAAWHVFLWATV